MLIPGAGTNSTRPASIVRFCSPAARVTGSLRPVAGSALLSTAVSVPVNCDVGESPSGATNSTVKVPGGTTKPKLPFASVSVTSKRAPVSSRRLTVTFGIPGSPGSLMPLLFSSRKTWSPRSALIGTSMKEPAAARLSSPMLPSTPEPAKALMPKSSRPSPTERVDRLAMVNSRSGFASVGASVGTIPMLLVSSSPNAKTKNGAGSVPGTSLLIENSEMSRPCGTPAMRSPAPS